MRDKLNLLIEELKNLKRIGVSTVYCEEASIDALRASVAQASANSNFFEDSRQEVTGSEPKAVVRKSPALVAKGSTGSIGSPPIFELPQGDKQMRWDWLREKVLNCSVCNEHINAGKKVVFGVGNIDAEIFFCGEAPGADEEEQGEPFVGKAGQLLTKIINAMGLERSDVYIGNIMNWRPQMLTAFGNRPPKQEEMNFCLPYLKAQLAVVEPKVIVALGATAVSGLMGADSKRRMSDVRGRWFDFDDTPLMITFHPSYLLRNNTSRMKRVVWEDMLKVMKKVGMEISVKQQQFFLEK